jgi:hypothetical protein
MNDSLLSEFASIAKTNGLTNLARFKAWAKKYPEAAAKYKEHLSELYSEVSFFTSGKRGWHKSDFLPVEEYNALIIEQNLKTNSAYLAYRKQQPAEVRCRLPSNPRDTYSTLKE